MVLTILAVLSVGATPVKIAVPELTYSGLSNAEGNALTEFFAERLSKQSGAKVVTPSMTTGLLGLERQRALLGCADGTSCVAELANAMGVDFVVVGTLARFGSGYTVTLKLVDARSVEVKLSASERLSTEDELSSWLTAIAKEWGTALAPPKPDTEPVRSIAPLVVGGAGVVTVIAGSIFLGLAGGIAGELQQRPLPVSFQSPEALGLAASRGTTFQSIGLVAAGLGLVTVVAGVVWWFLSEPAQPHARNVFVPNVFAMGVP